MLTVNLHMAKMVKCWPCLRKHEDQNTWWDQYHAITKHPWTKLLKTNKQTTMHPIYHSLLMVVKISPQPVESLSVQFLVMSLALYQQLFQDLQPLLLQSVSKQSREEDEGDKKVRWRDDLIHNFGFAWPRSTPRQDVGETIQGGVPPRERK